MSDVRIRFVLSDPRKESVCLEDVIFAFVRSGEKLKNLEVKNSAHALREAKKAFREAKRTMEEFEARLRGEITEEIAKDKARTDNRVDPNNPNPEWFGD